MFRELKFAGEVRLQGMRFFGENSLQVGSSPYPEAPCRCNLWVLGPNVGSTYRLRAPGVVRVAMGCVYVVVGRKTTLRSGKPASPKVCYDAFLPLCLFFWFVLSWVQLVPPSLLPP